jgi:preprotein translocase subunit SecD
MFFLVRIAYAAIVACCLVSASQAEAIGLTVTSVVIRSTNSSVAITLDRGSQQALSRFTSEHIGSKAALCVDGETIAEPVIRAPITGSEMEISLRSGGDLTSTGLAEKLSRPGARIEVGTSDQMPCPSTGH